MIPTPGKVENYLLQPVFTDERGEIFDILEERIGHVGMVTFVPGVTRGNHYHKISTQYSYILEGTVRLVTSNVDGSNRQEYILKPGTCTILPPLTVHTYTAVTEAKMLDLSTLSRNDDGYEKDTVKLSH